MYLSAPNGSSGTTTSLNKLPNPPGFIPPPSPSSDTPSANNNRKQQQRQPVSVPPTNHDGKQDALKLKKAWEIAFMPLKSLPMNGFMLWMSGNGIQIFSIIITVMLLYNPLKAIVSVQQTFRDLELSRHQSLLMCKLAFCLANCASILLGVWKCTTMGLLPTSTSDWLAFEAPLSVANVYSIFTS